jgi:hypothetical protein
VTVDGARVVLGKLSNICSSLALIPLVLTSRPGLLLSHPGPQVLRLRFDCFALQGELFAFVLLLPILIPGILDQAHWLTG